MTKSYLIAGFVLISIFISIIINVSLLFPFVASIAFSIFILSKQFKLDELVKMVITGVLECKVLYILILLIGANISVWMASGIVPAVMYYGFNYLKDMNFIFMAFLITSVMSVFMGTAVGTISTLGIALLGIGRGFGIPQGLLLGVLVSGAFIADKISPISGLLNLTLKVTETNYRELLKTMSKTLIPVFLLTGVIYFVIGSNYSQGENVELITEFQEAINFGFKISPLLLLLPLGVVLLPLKGIKIIPTILIGLIGGVSLSIFFQNNSLADTFRFIFFGYRGQTPSSELNEILVSGGIIGMVEIVLIVASVIALSSLLEGSGILKPLIYSPIAKVKSKGELIFKTGIIGNMLTIITCDQTVGIVLPSRQYKEKYREVGLDGLILARTISDTSTIIAPLIPWNVNAIIIALITGISAIEYAPYAVLCYLFPLTTVWIYLQGRTKEMTEQVKFKVSN